MQNIESIKTMSVQDRLQLIEAIWETLDENVFQEDDKEIALIEQRLKDFKKHPGQTESWENFKSRMIKKVNGGK